MATQLRRSQIRAGEITDNEINSSAGIATSKLADGTKFIQKDGSVSFTANQSVGGHKLTNVDAPVSASDAATKGYVDSVASGLDFKDSVRAATAAALPS